MSRLMGKRAWGETVIVEGEKISMCDKIPEARLQLTNDLAVPLQIQNIRVARVQRAHCPHEPAAGRLHGPRKG